MTADPFTFRPHYVGLEVCISGLDQKMTCIEVRDRARSALIAAFQPAMADDIDVEEVEHA